MDQTNQFVAYYVRSPLHGFLVMAGTLCSAIKEKNPTAGNNKWLVLLQPHPFYDNTIRLKIHSGYCPLKPQRRVRQLYRLWEKCTNDLEDKQNLQMILITSQFVYFRLHSDVLINEFKVTVNGDWKINESALCRKGKKVINAFSHWTFNHFMQRLIHLWFTQHWGRYYAGADSSINPEMVSLELDFNPIDRRWNSSRLVASAEIHIHFVLCVPLLVGGRKPTREKLIRLAKWFNRTNRGMIILPGPKARPFNNYC